MMGALRLAPIARIGAVVCLVLFALCLLLPGAYLQNYGVAPDPGGTFMVQRAAPMFLAVAAILWVIAGAPQSPLRGQILVCLALFFAGVAVTGVYHIATGQAGPGLWAGVVAEVIATVLLIGLRNR